MNSSEGRPSNERLWRYVERMAAAIFALGGITLMGLNYYFVKTSPRAPDLATGHVYATNIHGIVYLTSLECRLRPIPWMILWSPLFLGILARLVLGENPRSHERS